MEFSAISGYLVCSYNVFQELQMAFYVCANSILFSPKALQKVWSDYSPVLTTEWFLIWKSPWRLSQVAHILNGLLCCVNENTPETKGKDEVQG